MGFLHFSVGGPPVSDVLILKQAKGINRHLVHLSRKAADAGMSRQLIEAAHAIFLGKEANENGLHHEALGIEKDNTNPAG
jgi:hypothetical protein